MLTIILEPEVVTSLRCQRKSFPQLFLIYLSESEKNVKECIHNYLLKHLSKILIQQFLTVTGFPRTGCSYMVHYSFMTRHAIFTVSLCLYLRRQLMLPFLVFSQLGSAIVSRRIFMSLGEMLHSFFHQCIQSLHVTRASALMVLSAIPIHSSSSIRNALLQVLGYT